MDFCHLHIHNEYSQLDGLGTAKQYVSKAKKLGFEYLGLTNHGNIDGLIKFQDECLKQDIKPVLGFEGYIVEDIKDHSKKNKRHHISIWVKNQTGWGNVCSLLTEANLKGFHRKPRISFKHLLDHCEGLVIGTACIATFLNHKNGKRLFRRLSEKIGNDLYVEIMPHDFDLQYIVNQKVIQIAKRTGHKIIVTNDCHYVDRADWKAHEVLLAVQRSAKWDDPKRWKFSFKGLHLRSTKEMIKQMKKTNCYKKEYLSNTIEIAEKCYDFRIEKREVKLPRVNNILPKKELYFVEDICRKKLFDLAAEGYFKNLSNTNYEIRLQTEL